MTRRLILMRHAKSDWGSPGLPDHDRPLNNRGAKDAPAIGAWLRVHAYLPDEVLCSTATRTRETLSGLGVDATTQFLPALYHADPETMLDVLRRATGTTVLMVGHNPGIAHFAADILRQPPDHPRFDDYPTSATLVAQFEIDDWSNLKLRTGKAKSFLIPADLA
jgi:phosphohistidine phosphatase